MKIKRLRITIEPAGDHFQLFDMEVLTDKERIDVRDCFHESEFESRFDFMLAKARKEILSRTGKP